MNAYKNILQKNGNHFFCSIPWEMGTYNNGLKISTFATKYSCQDWGTRTRYRYSQYSSAEFLVLVLVSFKVILLLLVVLLMGKSSGTRTSTGAGIDILWYICGENHHTCEINILTYYKGKVSNWFIIMIWIYDTWDVIENPIISFNSIIIEKLTELPSWCSYLLLSFVTVHFPIQILHV